MHEFDIINKFFAMQPIHRSDVLVEIGDDAAIVNPQPGMELAITTDTLVSGVHFPESTSPYDIGYKSLAVNLSDLAAMGAAPAWTTMALTLPHEKNEWIQAFCKGFYQLAKQHHVQLIGGDLTHGPLTITIQVIGYTTHRQALLRSNASPGELVYVTGTLGDAGLALKSIQQGTPLDPAYQHAILERLHRPQPRLAAGERLRGIASSAIDISDGLAADLGHILASSQVGARINVDDLPLSEGLSQTLTTNEAIHLALTAGDDYELCFTIPPQKQKELEQQFSALPLRLTCIGTITEKPGLALHYQNGDDYHGQIHGYQHF